MGYFMWRVSRLGKRKEKGVRSMQQIGLLSLTWMRVSSTQRGLFPFSACFLWLTYYISVHNFGWAKGDSDLGAQDLVPYSQVQIQHTPLEEVGKGKLHSASASDYNLSFNFLKLPGKSIEGCPAFGQCQKWQMESGRGCGDDGGCWQGTWKCWHKFAGHGKGCPTCACLGPGSAG